MKDITIYHNILFPIDFSDDSIQIFPQALNLALKNDAELTMLYAFRLIQEEGNKKNDVIDLKNRVESEAKEKFAQLSDSSLNTTNVKTSFLCEIGFLSDRILATVNSNKTDLLLISKSVEEILKKEMKYNKKMITDSLSCEVMFLD